MFYAKLNHINSLEEKWIGINPRVSDNPIPLDEIELMWAIDHYLKKFKTQGWLLTITTGSC